MIPLKKLHSSVILLAWQYDQQQQNWWSLPPSANSYSSVKLTRTRYLKCTSTHARGKGNIVEGAIISGIVTGVKSPYVYGQQKATLSSLLSTREVYVYQACLTRHSLTQGTEHPYGWRCCAAFLIQGGTTVTGMLIFFFLFLFASQAFFGSHVSPVI